MNQNDIANMIDWVTRAIVSAATDGAVSYADLPEDERADFRKIAMAAMGAHDAWLTVQKYKIVPPGMIAPPTSRDEAAAMAQIGSEYLEKHAGSGLVMAPRQKLIN